MSNRRKLPTPQIKKAPEPYVHPLIKQTLQTYNAHPTENNRLIFRRTCLEKQQPELAGLELTDKVFVDAIETDSWRTGWFGVVNKLDCNEEAKVGTVTVYPQRNFLLKENFEFNSVVGVNGIELPRNRVKLIDPHL